MFPRFLKFFLLSALLAVFVAGCSKNDTSPTEPEGSAATIPTISFKGPNTNSQDVNAVMVKNYVSAMNSYSLIFTPLLALQGSQSGNTTTWTYTDRTLTVKFSATRQSDGSYSWKMVLNGVDPDDQTVYNNWTALEGTTSADGKNGNWKIYEENTTVLLAEYIWTTNNNVLTGTLKEYMGSALEYQSIVVNNPDNSGELRIYTGSAMTYKAVWQANGSGQWWTYDLNGTQTGTGNWT
ncbi:MAG: hypothetical protein FJ217_14545 [Ignavibacteria bacterium]|nr:hypothetical protein [Ignavibacteria bacterium]